LNHCTWRKRRRWRWRRREEEEAKKDNYQKRFCRKHCLVNCRRRILDLTFRWDILQFCHFHLCRRLLMHHLCWTLCQDVNGSRSLWIFTTSQEKFQLLDLQEVLLLLLKKHHHRTTFQSY
jgi:hypothetical protein